MSKTLPPVRGVAAPGLQQLSAMSVRSSTSAASAASAASVSVFTAKKHPTKRQKKPAAMEKIPLALARPPPSYSMRSSTESLGNQAAFSRQLADHHAARAVTTFAATVSSDAPMTGVPGGLGWLPGMVPDERPGSTGSAATLPSVSWGSDDGRYANKT